MYTRDNVYCAHPMHIPMYMFIMLSYKLIKCVYAYNIFVGVVYIVGDHMEITTAHVFVYLMMWS